MNIFNKIFSNYSTNNPIQSDTKAMKSIANFNQDSNTLKGDEIDKRIQKVVENLTSIGGGGFVTNEDLDGAVNMIEDPYMQTLFRQKLNLVDKRDVVCELSQGRLDEKYGVNACAMICLTAATHFLSEKEEQQPLKTQSQIYGLIYKGIDRYKNNDCDGKIEFTEALEKAKKSEPALSKLQFITPTHIEGFDSEMLQILGEMNLPLDGELNTHLKPMLDALSSISDERKQKACGILTCNGETITIAFDSSNRPQLFDSHGRKYRDMDKGASLLQFNNCNDLAEHMRNNLFKTNAPFQFIILGNAQ